MSHDITEIDGLSLRPNRASAGCRAHISVSRTEDGQLIGRVFGDSIAQAWEAVPAKLDAYKAKTQAKADDSAAVEAAEIKANDDAKAAALARLGNKTRTKTAAPKSDSAETEAN